MPSRCVQVLNHRRWLALRRRLQSGHTGNDAPPFLRIPVFSVSSHNPLVEPEWQQHGQGELAALREYQRLHNRSLPPEQVGGGGQPSHQSICCAAGCCGPAGCNGSSLRGMPCSAHPPPLACLPHHSPPPLPLRPACPSPQAAEAAWRRQASIDWFQRYREEHDMAPYLPRLLTELQDHSEVQRIARRFQVDQGPRRESPPPQRQLRDSPPPQRQRRESPPPPRRQRRDEVSPRQQQRGQRPVVSPRKQERQRQQDERGAQGAASPRPAGGSGKLPGPRFDAAAVPGSPAVASGAAAGSRQVPPQQHGEHMLAPSFISLSADPIPQVVPADAMVPQDGQQAAVAMPGQQRQQQQQQQGRRSAAAELRDTRETARVAPRESTDRPSSRQRAAAINASARMQSEPEAANRHLAAPGGGAGDQPAATAGAKRKRAPIQWQPQEAQPGDAPLQPPEVLAATAAAAAAAGPKSKHQKVAAGDAKADAKASKQAAAKQPPSEPPQNITITVRNKAPPASRPRKASPLEGREDAERGRRAAHAAASREAPAAARRPVRRPTPAPDGAALPPGFGGPSRTSSGTLREAEYGGDDGGGGGNGGGSFTVRMHLPASGSHATYADRLLPGPGGGGGSAPAAEDASAGPLEGGPSTLADRFGELTAAQQRLLADDGGDGLERAAAAAPGHHVFTFTAGPGAPAPHAPDQQLLPVFPPAVMAAVAEGAHRYEGGAAVASHAALLAYAQQLEQVRKLEALQQQQLHQQLHQQDQPQDQQQDQQQHLLFSPTAAALQLVAGYGGDGMGGQAAGVALLAEGESPPPQGHRVSRAEGRGSGGAGSGRVVQLEGGGGGGGRAAKGSGKGGKKGGGGGGGGAPTRAFWEPLWCWEDEAVELLLRQQDKGIGVEELQGAHPLPETWDQSPGGRRHPAAPACLRLARRHRAAPPARLCATSVGRFSCPGVRHSACQCWFPDGHRKAHAPALPARLPAPQAPSTRMSRAASSCLRSSRVGCVR